MTYTPFHADWRDYPDTTTPITAAALEYIEAGIVTTSSRSKEWFVDFTGTGDGTSYADASSNAQAVIDAASDGDIIYVINDVTGEFVIDKRLRIVGLGQAPTIGAETSTISTIAVHVNATRVTLENLTIQGPPDFKGVLLAVDAASHFRGIRLRLIGSYDGTPSTAYPTSGGAGTGNGGIGLLSQWSEGCYFEQLEVSNCSIGVVGGTESNSNVINRGAFASNVQDLVMGLNTDPGLTQLPLATGPYGYGNGVATSQGGGWTFINLKCVGETVVANTPVVDLIGDGTDDYGGPGCGSNIFLGADFAEAYNQDPIVRIGSARNTFIRPISAPQATWKIEGRYNTFFTGRSLGKQWIVNSDYNQFENFTTLGGWSGSGNANKYTKVDFSSIDSYPVNLTGASNIFDECFVGALGGTQPTIASLGTSPKFAPNFGVKALTYSATIASDVNDGTLFTIAATNTSAFTISNPIDSLCWSDPTKIVRTTPITYDIKNSSGGAMGTITWGAKFLLAGAFTNPANGKRRLITFYYNLTSDAWIEMSRAAADI